ncbi:MAG: thymidylate synthase [Phenylobacterium sp.]
METIYIKSRTLPEGWEKAVLETWKKGTSFRTEYDKPGDPESKDVCLMLHITEPFAEPRIHKCIPMGLNDLEKYVQEVVNGVHNSWINPAEGKWSYTYNQRLFAYKLASKEIFKDKIKHLNKLTKVVEKTCDNSSLAKMYQQQLDMLESIECDIDQIKQIIDKLKETPYTRRARAITWQPWEDYSHGDPPCLQSMSFRVEKSKCPICNGKGEIPHGLCFGCEGIGEIEKLNMNVVIRSNDAYKAAFSNLIAFTELQKYIADEVGVKVGEVSYYAESFHIYGSYFEEFKRFLSQVEKTNFEDRIWTSDYCIPFFIDGCNELLAEKNMPKEKKILIKKRKQHLGGVML